LAISRYLTAGVIAAMAAVFAGTVFAAHPLQTEDTGTQGAGNVEIENGLSWAHAAGDRLLAYQPQVSVGFSPAFDLIIQPSWLSLRHDAFATVRGRGDSNLDAKWRFFGNDPLSFAVRAGATLATSAHDLGLPQASSPRMPCWRPPWMPRHGPSTATSVWFRTRPARVQGHVLSLHPPRSCGRPTSN
jgi:hypothetical protein